MISREEMNKYPEVDWSVYKSQQTPTYKPEPSSNTVYEENINNTPKKPEQKMVDTFLGKLPSSKDFQSYLSDPKIISEMIGMAIGGPGIKMAGKLAPLARAGVMKGIDYLHPGRAAESFRSTLGEGTSSKNIETLSKRAQFAKNSTKEEALIPKRELYSQEGKSDVFKVKTENLPEGNLEKFSGMIDEGGEFGKSQMDALSKAIKNYRKTGKIESFLEKSEDIFNIPELSEKATGKIEDVLSMPVKRDSAYFSDKEVTMPYSKKGNLITRHNEYYKNPIMNNYQELRSALTTQMRKLKVRAKTDDVAAEKYDQMTSNLANLDKDASSFIETLPEKMKNLDSKFRKKYTDYAQTYVKGDKETGPSLTLRRLAEGRNHLVDDNAIVRLFSKPTAADQKAILDMGTSGARNAIYSALQRVPVGDAEKMAKTILDLKRTKGFDKIITPEIEGWANNMLKHVNRASGIKKALGSAGGAITGGAIFGPVGAAVGASLPWGIKGAKYLAERFKK